MKRWYVTSASILSLSLVAVFGSLVRSNGPAANDNQPATKIAVSRIDRVTVYPNSALVTREVEVPAGKGLVESARGLRSRLHQHVPRMLRLERLAREAVPHRDV